MPVPVPLELLVLMQGTVSQEIFQPQLRHLSGKPEEDVPFLSPNDTACWSRTCHKAQLYTVLLQLLISAPSLGVYYCQQLTLSVCLSLCLSLCRSPRLARSHYCQQLTRQSVPLSVCHTPSNWFFFCFYGQSSHFLAISSPCGTVQNAVFWFLI